MAQLDDAYKRLLPYCAFMILPNFVGYIQQYDVGMWGEANAEKHKQILLNRIKCLIEDMYALGFHFAA